MKHDMGAARADLLSPSVKRQQRGVRTVRELADTGDPLAVYALATWHLHGSHGYKVDLALAKKMLEVACEKQVPEAMYSLAILIETNETGRDRKRKAFGLYVLAAVLGDEDAIRELRRCFHWGSGTYKDVSVANMIADYLESRPDDRMGT